MENKLKQILGDIKTELASANTSADCQAIRVKNIGKSGLITDLLKELRNVPGDQRASMGALINSTKSEAETLIFSKEQELKNAELLKKLSKEKIDVTLDKTTHERGVIHPINMELEKFASILTGMGFTQIRVPEIDWDKYNFELLNVPKDHPSRDMQDSYFITSDILLRTQTTNFQGYAFEKFTPPMKIFNYGMVFRKDDIDATHTAAFHQIDAFYVDEKKNVNLADLKNMLSVAIKQYLGDGVQISFRPSFFPFTEPSLEVDAVCPACGGKGCADCKFVGGYEILGAGLIHPNVLKMNGLDPEKYSGYAFGLGFDRYPKMKYKIPFPQLMYDNDIRFLEEFK